MSAIYESYKTDLKKSNTGEDVQISLFSSEEFKSIRAFSYKNEPWFVGKDIAESLGYKDTDQAIRKHVDKDDKQTRQFNGTGQMRKMIIINESGLYSLILSSKLENAKKFKKWITSEVLPSIRKHGAYMTEDTIEKALTSPDFLIQLATKLKEEQEKSKDLEDKLEKNSKMLNQISASKNSLLVREVAKILSNKHSIQIGEKQLYKKLREWGWVFQKSTEAKQEALRNGYLEVREGVLENSKGTYVYHTTRVTGKGQRKILEKLLTELEEGDINA